MKKIISICLLTLIFAIPQANSQILIGMIFGDKVNNEYMQMGFSVGGSLTNITNIEGGNYAPNIQFGLDLKILYQKDLNIHTGIFFSSPVTKSNLTPKQLGIPYLDSVFSTTDTHIKLGYVSLPVYANYKLTKNISVEAGLSFAYLHKANMIYSLSDEKNTLTYTKHIKDDVSKFDIQAGGGFVYAFREGEGIRINLRYNQGLMDVIKNDILKENNSKASYNQAFQLLVEIPIKGDKEVNNKKE